MNKRLTLSTDKKIAGVCGGIAEYFSLDPTLVRLAWAFLTICTCFCGVILYIVGWIIIPNK